MHNNMVDDPRNIHNLIIQCLRKHTEKLWEIKREKVRVA